MAIRFACRCGKQLQARDDFAGRKMKCPACQQVIAIPGGGAGEAAPPALPPKTFQGQEILGRSIAPNPPHAAAAPPPPEQAPLIDLYEAEEEVVVARTTAQNQPRPQPNAWSTDTLNQEITPWPRGVKKRVGAVAERDRGTFARWLLVLVLLLLVGGAVAGMVRYGPEVSDFLLNAEKDVVSSRVEPKEEVIDWQKYTDLDMIPRGGAMMVSFQVAELPKAHMEQILENALPPQWRQNLPPGGAKNKVKPKPGNLSPADVERITAFLPSGDKFDPKNVLVLVRTVKPYDRARLQQVLVKDDSLSHTGPEPLPVDAGPTGKLGAQEKVEPEVYVSFLNDRTLLFGSGDAVKMFLHAAPAPMAPGPMGMGVRLAREKHLLVAVIQQPGKIDLKKLPLPKEEVKLLQTVGDADLLTLTFDWKAILALHLQFAYGGKKDEAKKKAAEALAAAETLKAQGTAAIDQIRQVALKKSEKRQQEAMAARLQTAAAIETVGMTVQTSMSPLVSVPGLAGPMYLANPPTPPVVVDKGPDREAALLDALTALVQATTIQTKRETELAIDVSVKEQTLIDAVQSFLPPRLGPPPGPAANPKNPVLPKKPADDF